MFLLEFQDYQDLHTSKVLDVPASVALSTKGASKMECFSVAEGHVFGHSHAVLGVSVSGHL